MLHTEKEVQTEYLRSFLTSHCLLLSVVSLLGQTIKVHRFSFVYLLTMAKMHGGIRCGICMIVVDSWYTVIIWKVVNTYLWMIISEIMPTLQVVWLNN